MNRHVSTISTRNRLARTLVRRPEPSLKTASISLAPSLRWLLVVALLPLLACAEGVGPLDVVDPDAAPAHPTYNTHVAPIVDYYCVSCHSKDAQPGAVDGYAYDSCAQVRDGWHDFYETTVTKKSMPPGGALRVTSTEALILTRWYAQGAECEDSR